MVGAKVNFLNGKLASGPFEPSVGGNLKNLLARPIGDKAIR
jgi:hypothetical protein